MGAQGKVHSEKELNEVKESIGRHYRKILTVFAHYAGVFTSNRGQGAHTLKENGYTKLVRDCHFIEDEDDAEEQASQVFVLVNVHVNKSGKNDIHALSRHEFLEVIVRLA